jgi:hypothetical protein
MPRVERVVHELRDLRQVGASRLRIRVVEPANTGCRFVDIRESRRVSTFTGWTRRGIRLDAESFQLS